MPKSAKWRIKVLNSRSNLKIKTEKRILNLLLQGGLGNQLFQFAAGLAFAKKTRSMLRVDAKSGFVFDRQFKREYKIDKITSNFNIRVPLHSSLKFWFYLLERKATRFPKNIFDPVIVLRRPYGTFIEERKQLYVPKIHQLFDMDNWLIGYFQSYKYFKNIQNDILNAFSPQIQPYSIYASLGSKLRAKKTLALGIRLFEECKNPEVQSFGGKQKSINSIVQVMQSLREKKVFSQIAIFCTHRSKLFAELNLPSNTIYVTPEEGYSGDVETLWLLTQCKHHLFNNSTFYWWGAWLSQKTFGGTNLGQKICISDNFLNPDIYCEGWKKY